MATVLCLSTYYLVHLVIFPVNQSIKTNDLYSASNR